MISALESYTGNNERALTPGFPFITSFRKDHQRGDNPLKRPQFSDQDNQR